jgi:23S rRNA (cytidine1920-2'-O)/16S rRNA (cytidine1409-2'-O)-methyltransferase
MASSRLDQYLFEKRFTTSRNQAENYIKLGYVTVDGKVITKPGSSINQKSVVVLTASKTYVSRAALKLKSVADKLELDFNNKSVLDVCSSNGGFTDYALQHGAAKVIAVDVGTNQLHTSLRTNPKIELHEQTDIRSIHMLSTKVSIVLVDVSFISIKEVLKHLPAIITKDCIVVAMVKPQFELASPLKKHKGVIKNETERRNILRSFEAWTMKNYKIINKADSLVSGVKGNKERFYLLKLL